MKESSKRRDIRAPFHDKVHIIKPLLQTTGMILFFSWFFYRSVFAIIVLILPGIWYFKGCVRRQRNRNQWELTIQFKECILAVSNSLKAGYAVENAFLESREDIRMLYGERSVMYCELELIRRGMILNITLEELVEDLAERSGCDEIRQFSAVLPFAIALYIGSTYPGYFAPLYHNMSGYIVMTVCFVIYIGAYMTGEKIMDRIADSL